jgi:quercetin dioxygenase-like cupin family protein
MTIRASVTGAIIVASALGSAALAADMPAVTSANEVKWGPAPPSLPPGAQLAVMSGDPASKGFVSLRAKLPAGYVIRPHFHPTDEHVTVLSGTLSVGMGDTLDAATAKHVGPGGYFIAAAQMHHYAVAKTAVVIQVDLEGPFDITYVNPADAPRNKGK